MGGAKGQPTRVITPARDLRLPRDLRQRTLQLVLDISWQHITADPRLSGSFSAMSAMFTVSPSSSVASSRSSSPASLERTRDWRDEKNDDLPGLNAMDVYEATLPWWRAALRRQIVKNVTWESNVIARIQVSFRFNGMLLR